MATIPQVNWRAYFALFIAGESLPLRNMRIHLATDSREIDVTTAERVGWHDLPARFDFTADMIASGAGVAIMTNVQLERLEASFGLVDRIGSNWAFQRIGFNRCKIVDCDIDGVAIDQLTVHHTRVKCLKFAITNRDGSEKEY